MARLLDTIPAFEAYARKANMESPLKREMMWKDQYRGAHPEVFDAFEAASGSPGGLAAVVRELSRVRSRVDEAAPAMRHIVEEVDPVLGESLGMPPEPAPLHVLMVGSFATNAAVGPLGDDMAVFHCLEWFQSASVARALVAHEGAHAWHRIKMGVEAPPEDDLPWLTFSEGFAIQVSRAVVPDLAEVDYFWYGHPEVEDWLPWCDEHRDDLLQTFSAGIDAPETVEAFFGGGFVETKWHVGYYVADVLVGGLGRPLPELARMGVAEGRAAIRTALGVGAD